MGERRRVKQIRSLEERMAEQAAKLKTMADRLPAGAERDQDCRDRRPLSAGLAAA
jgi:hypothetical protein